MAALVTELSLKGSGTDETVWSGCTELQNLELLQLPRPASDKVVVVAPHPDDEVLGAGGISAALAANGVRITLVSVTDGEASHVGRAEELRALRPCESASAAAVLGTRPRQHLSLHLPDGAVDVVAVENALAAVIDPDDLVLAPWEHDGHPDHDHVGVAARRVCQRTGASLLGYLVWAWHWAKPSDLPWSKASRFALGDGITRRKRSAVRCFDSQLSGVDPILSDSTVRRLTRDFEVFLSP